MNAVSRPSSKTSHENPSVNAPSTTPSSRNHPRTQAEANQRARALGEALLANLEKNLPKRGKTPDSKRQPQGKVIS